MNEDEQRQPSHEKAGGGAMSMVAGGVEHVVREVPRVSFVAGYVEARKRFEQASQHREAPDEMFAPLFETLSWAASLEEKLRPHDDPLLRAVSYARNRVHHQWSNAVEARDYPFPQVTTALASSGSRPVSPTFVWDWFWRDVQELHAPPRRYRKGHYRTGKVHYIEILAGKAVRIALADLERVFMATRLPDEDQ